MPSHALPCHAILLSPFLSSSVLVIGWCEFWMLVVVIFSFLFCIFCTFLLYLFILPRKRMFMRSRISIIWALTFSSRHTSRRAKIENVCAAHCASTYQFNMKCVISIGKMIGFLIQSGRTNTNCAARLPQWNQWPVWEWERVNFDLLAYGHRWCNQVCVWAVFRSLFRFYLINSFRKSAHLLRLFMGFYSRFLFFTTYDTTR